MTRARIADSIGFLSLGFALAFAPPAGAQLSGTLDAGGGSARIDGAVSGTVGTLAPAFAWEGRGVRLDASGVYSGLGGLGWNAQGLTAVTVRALRSGELDGELAARYAWSAHQLGSGTHETAIDATLKLRTGLGALFWVGGGLGRVSALTRAIPAVTARAGVTTLVRHLSVGVSVSHTAFTEGSLDPAPGGFPPDTLGNSADTVAHRNVVDFTNVALSAQWRRAEYELAGSLGRRIGRVGVAATSWSMSATRWLNPQLALVAGAGRYSADVVSRLPAGRYVTLSMRVAFGSAPATLSPGTADSAVAPVNDRAALRFRRDGDGLVALSFAAPGASLVELMADFTDWNPVALARAGDGRWELRLPVTPGLHRMVVRMDGGPWRVPAGARAEANEYGRDVGVVVFD